MEQRSLVDELCAKHSQGGLLIDTNLLLLLVVGNYDRRRIETFKRTLTYTLKDFQRLKLLASRFNLLLTTPNILTEVDNLGRQLAVREWNGFSKSLAALCLQLRETYLSSSAVMQASRYSRMGLTDSGVLSLKSGILILSDDLGLYLEASKAGYAAINFNHLRH
jgi:hypothetical protein